jgi:CheY-like chemotaxis protein
MSHRADRPKGSDVVAIHHKIEPPAISFASRPDAPDRARLPAIRLRVLVVDDNRDAADTLAGLLLLCGATVRVSYDGVSAAQVADDFRPDVGLFDVNMPGLDGCELAKRVRAGAGNRPLLLAAITGVSDDGATRRTGAAGFNMHLTKPADPAALVATLADFSWWLEGKRAAPTNGGKA